MGRGLRGMHTQDRRGQLAVPSEDEAAQQRDEADEGKVEAERSMVGVSCHGVADTMHRGAVVRPSQLIASVGWTWGGGATT